MYKQLKIICLYKQIKLLCLCIQIKLLCSYKQIKGSNPFVCLILHKVIILSLHPNYLLYLCSIRVCVHYARARVHACTNNVIWRDVARGDTSRSSIYLSRPISLFISLSLMFVPTNRSELNVV